jgi:hypothetical protein
MHHLALLAALALGAGSAAAAAAGCPGELRYNNICLPKAFPPRAPISKVGLYPIVTFQYSSTTLYQFSYHIQ